MVWEQDAGTVWEKPSPSAGQDLTKIVVPTDDEGDNAYM